MRIFPQLNNTVRETYIPQTNTKKFPSEKTDKLSEFILDQIKISLKPIQTTLCFNYVYLIETSNYRFISLGNMRTKRVFDNNYNILIVKKLSFTKKMRD